MHATGVEWRPARVLDQFRHSRNELRLLALGMSCLVCSIRSLDFLIVEAAAWIILFALSILVCASTNFLSIL